MARCAVAAGTPLAASIGAEVAEAGGNAADAALAAVFASWVCEPALTSLGSVGLACVWPPGEDPVAIDCFCEVPGRGLADRSTTGGHVVTFPYGGGVTTGIGAGSVATPGSLAGMDLLWRRWGSMPWPDLLAPANHLAREGFPLPPVSARYFESCGETVFEETPGASQLWRREDGTPRPVGDHVRIPDLADTLEQVAFEGAEAFYTGAIADRIDGWMAEHGGVLRRADLAAYEARALPCDLVRHGAWSLATPPMPSLGGVALNALLREYGAESPEAWDAAEAARFARCMGHAFEERDRQQARRLRAAASTTHVSTVDEHGLTCSVTTSNGYSSGVVVPGTGICFNNVLGELELAPDGWGDVPPGTSLHSNMAPVVARSTEGNTLALGTAGADRIPSALARTWIALVGQRMALADAVEADRCHMEDFEGTTVLAHEPGIDPSEAPWPPRPFDTRHMYFGGVQAVERSADGRLLAAADTRRDGGAQVRG